MKRLFTIDLKNYDENGTRFYRPSVRGIIFDDEGRLAMAYSQKYHYYKFPGGGIDEGESRVEALVREVKEETGLAVIPESIKEFGEVLRLQKGDAVEVFVQYNYYYTCKVRDEIGEQELTDKEREAGFVLKFVLPSEAIRANKAFESADLFKHQMIERERRVLEILRDENTSTRA